MAHYRYREQFIEAIIKDVEPFCLNKTDTLGLDKAHMEEAQKVEEIFPKVVDLFFNDPTDKIKTIATFKNNIVSEEYLSDHASMVPALKHIVNTILRKSKINLLSSQEKDKEWKEALRISYNSAVRDGVYPNPKIGSTLEHEIATSLTRVAKTGVRLLPHL